MTGFVLAAIAPITTPSVDWLGVAPVIALGGAGVAIVLARALLRRSAVTTPVCVALGILGVVLAAIFEYRLWHLVRADGAITTMAGMVRVDPFGVFLSVVVLIGTIYALFISVAYLKRESLDAPEYLALIMLSAAGMVAIITANDLIAIFVALEVLSIPLYVLAAFDRRRMASQEAGLKYFVLGAFSSAVFLYGVALTYGATGSTSLTAIGDFLANNTLYEQGTLLAGGALLLAGLGFKVAAVPFHFWTPDVYEGAPTPVTAFMAAATKTAAFAVLIRVFSIAFPLYRTDWKPALWVLAVLTLVVGSVAALVQTDVKRILAYSAIAHSGYILIGFQTGTIAGRQAALLYLLIYTFMAIGTFAVIMLASMTGDDRHSLDDYRGFALQRPVLGGILIFFLLAQAGIPLTGGFIAKLEVFSAAAQSHDYSLLVIGVLAAVVAMFFYLRSALALVSPATGGEYFSDRRVDRWSGVVVATAALAVLATGVTPGPFIDWARQAVYFV